MSLVQRLPMKKATKTSAKVEQQPKCHPEACRLRAKSHTEEKQVKLTDFCWTLFLLVAQKGVAVTGGEL